jgi:hypothetical protein
MRADSLAVRCVDTNLIGLIIESHRATIHALSPSATARRTPSLVLQLLSGQQRATSHSDLELKELKVEPVGLELKCESLLRRTSS